jgi:hypothetical protein
MAVSNVQKITTAQEVVKAPTLPEAKTAPAAAEPSSAPTGQPGRVLVPAILPSQASDNIVQVPGSTRSVSQLVLRATGEVIYQIPAGYAEKIAAQRLGGRLRANA